MKYDAIILAGGENTSELRQMAPCDNEALIIIGNLPMIHYVYNALTKSNCVNRIVISGPVESLRNIFPPQEKLFFVKGGQNAIESFSNGLELLRQMENVSEKILILPTDIPFITPEAISDFVSQCEKTDADFYYSVTRREVNERKFPGVARTYVNLKEGTFTGGNVFLIRSGIADKCLDLGLQLVIRRKSPVAMAKLFGLSLVWKYMLGRLGIPEIVRRFQKVTGIKGQAVISPYAEVGVDVDKPSDLILAQEYLTAR